MMLLEESAWTSDRTPVHDRVAEANHRIANSLTAIAALLEREAAALSVDALLEAKQVRRLFGEVRARIDAVAGLHKLLSDAEVGDPIDVGSYLQQVAAQVVSGLARPEAVTLHYVCEVGCRAAPERALHLGLILVELLTNSLKYAHPAGVPGIISISSYRGHDHIVVDVSDDGVGLPESFDPDSGSGLRLVRSLARQIGGTVRFASDELGFRCTVNAPILASVPRP